MTVGGTASGRLFVPEIRLDRAVHLDCQLIAVAVLGGAGGHADPALADAIFLDVGLLDALEADADVARQNLRVVVRALWIDRQAVRQFVRSGLVLAHSSASVYFFNASGVVVGACRETTRPDRSARNLVKFHLIADPNRPDF